MKKRICVLVLFVLTAVFAVSAFAGIPAKPSEYSYYYDYDGSVLSSSQKSTIEKYGNALEDATGDQVIAVIVSFLDGMSAEDYATDIINTWQIGQSGSDNGVVILLSTGDRAIQIGTGKGLDRVMTGGTAGSLIDSNIDYFANDQFGDGMTALYEDVCNYLADARGKTLNLSGQGSSGTMTSTNSGDHVPDASYYGYDEGGGTSLFEIIIGLIVVYFIISIIFNAASRNRGGGNGCLNWLFLSWLFNNNRRPPRGGGFGGPRNPPPPPPPRGGFGGGPRGGGARGPAPRSGGFGGGFGGGSGGRSAGGRSFGGGGSSRGFGGGSSRGGGAGRKF